MKQPSRRSRQKLICDVPTPPVRVALVVLLSHEGVYISDKNYAGRAR